MSIQAAITHRTTYKYDKAISMGPQIVRLRPAPHCRTRIVSYSLSVQPQKHFLNWQQDPFGNFLARLVLPEKTRKFEVRVDLVADMLPINPFDFFLEDSAYYTPFKYDAATVTELTPYLERVEGGKRLEALVRQERLHWKRDDEQRTIDFLVGINQRLQEAIRYTVRMEPGVQTPEQTLEKELGSCRDSTWLLVALLRELGIAARFVSGYLIQLKADETSLTGPSGPDRDFTDLHAWAEAYLPGAGWVGLDPTSGLFAAEGHIPLAATPAPQSAAAISGGHEACEVTFDFDMSVERALETPRITLPYTGTQWRAINKAGQSVDKILDAEDVRLTMGGEPTFVAGTDRDAGEWNIDAVGPTKRAYADQFVRKLRDRFAPDGVIHHGQGKWYPGEPLPRWAFSLYWRGDAVPLWQDHSLIAKESGKHKADAIHALRFMEKLCDNLGLEGDYSQPVYEDPAEYIMAEAELPQNVTTADSKLEDPEERERLAAVFSRGLGKPAAYVLPVQASQARASTRQRRAFRWISERWTTRRKKLFLKPGDSPAGFRLPLNSLAWLAPTDRNDVQPLDPFAARGPLPALSPRLQSRSAAPEAISDIAPGDMLQGNSSAVRTALSVEPRDGIVCVFLPPLRSSDEFVDLVAALEETARDTKTAIHIEGYPPPTDERMNLIKVTPDPGVIEINVHPGANWPEQVAITNAIYEVARECGLEASKFMIDGRPTGSGGGSHIVVGGARPEDSPFLRRPDVLASLLRFWQNHPSLSYFFSGMFIGPTSQAPRIDEARHDSLYELEIALRQIPDPLSATNTDCPPWLVDRLFRHLLTDVSGNTHRAEICIDKLFSPDSSTGRLGLVEFRGFEMPPHPQMNLSQQLLLRGLIAWFWRAPYQGKLIRFGTALNDRFMLPHFLREDLHSVLGDLSAGLGVAFDPTWFDPQFEFRFPLLGRIEEDGVEVELRAALEPWHVLGEEGTAGGTARFVDSSLERVQVKVRGLETAQAIACNGIRVPLTSTDEENTYVAGVRFKSWQPASSLHPTIAPHTPLVFDVYNTRHKHVVTGATYYTSHPGGFNFETQPVNALEADGRRQARFSSVRARPADYVLRDAQANPEFPVTLDMRRFAG